MSRWFNTAGPCNSAKHYMLPAARRLPDVRRLIDQESYFVVHAPRQAGKTTALLSLAQELTSEGRYLSVLVSMEVGAAFPEDFGAAEAAVLDDWKEAATAQLSPGLCPPPFPEAPPGRRIGAALSAWAQSASRPLVVFLDEIDALQGAVLISVLRQLRSGYRNRPERFPASLALIGLRDVRDYKVSTDSGEPRGTTSPFNIKVESLTLRDFTRDEVAELYAQHTQDTGQVFQPEAVERAFYWTRGQPWLVNALARQLVEKQVPDPTQPITSAQVDAAKEVLIRRQDTHLDSLAERLREPRVRAILEPILAGLTLDNVPEDDVRFVQDLGLARMTETGGLEVANPLYRGRMDLCLRHGPDTLALELKVWRDGERDPREEGLAQLERYLAGLGLDHGWLVIFDRRRGQPPLAERTRASVIRVASGRRITVVRA